MLNSKAVVGKTYKNFGAIVKAIETHDHGVIVEVLDITVDGVRQGGAGSMYIADPSKLEEI
jgi:hypothetical protein